MVLIDTNIVSELCRPSPNRGVLEWAGSITEISISAVSIEEIWFGLSWKPNVRVQGWFDVFLSRSCKVLTVTAEIAQGPAVCGASSSRRVRRAPRRIC